MIGNPHLCPDHLRESLDRYANDGVPTGGFLRAVLENDLLAAIGSADEINSLALPHIVAYVYNEMPAGAWGSPENVDRYLKGKRMEARAKLLAAAMPPESAR